MPKNPVRAARQSGRQEVRAAKQTSKVAKIQSRTQTKVAKIQGRSGTPAAATTPAPKFKTAAELKSTIKMPDMAATINKVGREVSIKNATGYKAPAPAAKKVAPKKKAAPKPKAAAPVKKYSPAVELAIAKKNYEDYRKEQQKGTYITKPENRNMEQKSKVKEDNAKKVVEDLKAIQNKAFNDAKANPKNEDKYAASDRAAKAALNARRAKLGLPPMRMGGSTYKHGGGMKGKKC